MAPPLPRLAWIANHRDRRQTWTWRGEHWHPEQTRTCHDMDTLIRHVLAYPLFVPERPAQAGLSAHAREPASIQQPRHAQRLSFPANALVHVVVVVGLRAVHADHCVKLTWPTEATDPFKTS
eukprot:2945161-Amphidinium_carterae.1